jgi:pentatricopeptide repeat protein
MANSNQILEKYLSTLEKDPSSRVFAPLAEYYRKNGLLNQAIDTLSQGIKHNPEYVLGHLGLAFCHFDNGDSKRAYDILRPLVSANRDNIRMLKLFSDVCLDLKNNEKALEYLKYLLFVNPRDKETAEKVKLLESENTKFGPIKFNVQDEIVTNQESPFFDVDALGSEPENTSSVDEWVQVDLKVAEEEKPSLDAWSMEKDVSLKEEEPSVEEEVREFKVDSPKEPVERKKSGDSPVITHTLVDLYCNQGYLDKAKDLLEKILELNPNDLKTKLKLQEVERVLSEAYLDDLGDDEEEVISEESSETEDAGRDQLMSLVDKTIGEDSKKPNLEIVAPPKSSDLLEKKLWAFHSALVSRSKEVLSN